MSISILTSVWKHSKAKGSGLIVLLAVADFANEQGAAYPSVGRLAKKSRMSPRNVRYVIQNLVTLGELEVKQNAGPKGCNVFRVATFAGVQSVQGEPGFTKGVQQGSVGTATAIAPEPSLTVIEPSMRSVSGIQARFGRFWQAYPKRRSKDAAFKAFSKINPDEQLLTAMLAAIETAKTQDQWTKSSGTFIPYPAKWLTAGGWMDEVAPPAPAERRVSI